MKRFRKTLTLGLVSILLLPIMAALAAMRPANELELQVLKGRKPDSVEDLGRGGQMATYRFKGDLGSVVSDLEQQLGPSAHGPNRDSVDWHLVENYVVASRGKLNISQEEITEENLSRWKAKLGYFEWLKSQGYDKWVTIQVQQEPSSFSRLWFRVQDIFHL